MDNPPPVALVTGAAKRIGAAIARRLHADGYALALHAYTSQPELQSLVAELDAARPGSVLALQADLRDFDRIPELLAHTVGRFGRLDALVNNASAFFPTPFGTVTPDQWDTLMTVNARAPFFLAQSAAPHLRHSGGAIVNLIDLYAERPREDLSAYAVSKTALLGVTRALAAALAPEVRVNAIAPGAILWPEDGIDPALQSRLLERTPLARTGTPEDIAEAVRWLLRDARYVTGETLRLDGGRATLG